MSEIQISTVVLWHNYLYFIQTLNFFLFLENVRFFTVFAYFSTFFVLEKLAKILQGWTKPDVCCL
jgi:hypothetical protein